MTEKTEASGETVVTNLKRREVVLTRLTCILLVVLYILSNSHFFFIGQYSSFGFYEKQKQHMRYKESFTVKTRRPG